MESAAAVAVAVAVIHVMCQLCVGVSTGYCWGHLLSSGETAFSMYVVTSTLLWHVSYIFNATYFCDCIYICRVLVRKLCGVVR